MQIEALNIGSLDEELPTLLREMGVSYEPDRLAKAISKKPRGVAGRAIRVSLLLGGIFAGIAADIASGQFESNAERRATELSRVLGRLGPSFIKVGQALSARPDLLPKPYLDALSRLQDRLPPFPSPMARALIEEELGRPVHEVFSRLSEDPVAAASLGQVFRGVLRSTGEEVAVKVQRPGISEGIAIDMVLLRRLMKAVDKNVSAISQPLVPFVDEFAGRLFAELDYEQEGRNAERFAKLYSHVPRVRVPTIKWEATTRRVLTMEWIEGVKLTNRKEMAAAGLDIVDFVTVGVECTLRQLLEAGFFHADPHPGNLLAMKTGELCYLDFGMMSEAPEAARYALIAHVVHLVNRDYQAMCRDYYALDFMDPSVDTSPIAPALADFFDDLLRDSTVSKLNFRTLVDGLGGVLFSYPFRVPAYYALILRSLTVLEGLAINADPNYKLLAAAYPYMAKRLLTDPAPQLRASFEELILQEDGRLRWGRLENLMREGSKSQDFDPQQLWMLAEWVLSDAGRPLRRPLARELIRLVDAVAASNTRTVLSQRLGDSSLASTLVPFVPEEGRDKRRAQALWGWITGSSMLPSFEVYGPQDIPKVVRKLQDGLSRNGSKIRGLLEKPGLQELFIDVQLGLFQRITARGVKAVASFGTNQETMPLNSSSSSADA